MGTYRNDALAQLDVRAFYAGRGLELGTKVGADEYRYHCFTHDDREASANLNVRTGLWHCHVCDRGGGPVDYLMVREAMSIRAAIEVIGEMAGLGPMAEYGRPAPIDSTARRSVARASKENVERWHEAALRNPDLLRWLHERRGYTDETIAHWRLGWDGQRVTIPVEDATGKLVNVRRYLRNAASEQQKMLNIAGSGEGRIWPVEGELPPDVILVEGEWDAILMRQQGFENTVTATAGAITFKPEWVPLFAGRRVTVIYDNDDAGRRGSAKVARMLAASAVSVRVCQIPNLPEKGDPTDFFVEQQRSADELRQLIADAPEYLVAATTVAEPEDAERVPLHMASDARYQGKRLELPVLLSGKAMTPYTIPFRFNVHCGMNNRRYCGICPLAEASGNRDVTLTARDPAVLSLVNVTDEARYKALKVLAGAVPQCSLPQVEVAEHINVEELRIIPEIDAGDTGDAEYVARQGFFLGHGLKANLGYAMRGYSHPHPKTQATVHLLSEAIPAQDNISAFALTPEIRDRLHQFQPEQGGAAVAERWADIYADFAGAVHRIQDRFDMQVAYDLVWHSVIAFTFNGAHVRRGWTEAMVISDSGQGKTEMAMNLLRHYRLGERVQAEQSSAAGLIGGLEKMGDTWLLSWGRIPLNDRRLLVIDETQGLPSSQIEGMSDVRATGVAEITKIRTERTHARCRIIWLANPVSGLTIAQHNQGVLAIKELFTKPEDIRRLDFALALGSGDVDFARSINVAHGSAGVPRYSSEACRALVLWAWSRRPDQVAFTPEATDEILAAATDMGRRYHSSIPLVEPSDQRLKLARLSAAAAARVYSTDADGEQLIVRPEHVAFVVDYLDRVYNAKAMAYGEYSIQHRRGETLDVHETDAAAAEIGRWENGADAVAFFRAATVFRKAELEDTVGWDADYVKAQLRFLTNNRLIRTTRNGFVKTPAFIGLLRGLNLTATVAADLDAVLEGAKF